jgi:predicted XRE-type DNA-binding protein
MQKASKFTFGAILVMLVRVGKAGRPFARIIEVRS